MKKHIDLTLRRSVPVLGRSNVKTPGLLANSQISRYLDIAAPGDGRTPPENFFRES
jgi:hypothetical protein